MITNDDAQGKPTELTTTAPRMEPTAFPNETNDNQKPEIMPKVPTDSGKPCLTTSR